MFIETLIVVCAGAIGYWYGSLAMRNKIDAQLITGNRERRKSFEYADTSKGWLKLLVFISILILIVVLQILVGA